MSALLLKSRKMCSYPNCSLWIPIAVAKIYFLCVVLIWRKNRCILKIPLLKRRPGTVFSSISKMFHERALLISILYHARDAWWEGWMYYSKHTTVFVYRKYFCSWAIVIWSKIRQAAVINILNLHILIMTWRFVCTLHTFSKVTVEI